MGSFLLITSYPMTTSLYHPNLSFQTTFDYSFLISYYSNITI